MNFANRKRIFDLFDENNVPYRPFYGPNESSRGHAITVIKDALEKDKEFFRDENFDFEEASVNLAAFIFQMMNKKKLVRTINQYSLYESDTNIFLVDEKKQELLYLLKFDYWRLFEFTAACSIKTWRMRKNLTFRDYKIDSYTVNNFLLFKVLLNRVDSLVIDCVPPSYWKYFWPDRIAIALDEGLYIYYLDLKNNRKIMVTTWDDFLILYEELGLFNQPCPERPFEKWVIAKQAIWG